MKITHKFFIPLLLLCLSIFPSCELLELQQILPREDEVESQTDEDTAAITPSDRYTVVFEFNETFKTETARLAAERIDPAIRKAVMLLNTTDEEPISILDCDYDARPKQRDTLKHPLSIELYDHMLAAVSAFEDYHFNQRDYPGEDLFNIFVSALDALRTDRTEVFLYCDGKINGEEYCSGYFMPGNALNNLCNDREAIRTEVELCNAVVDRILEKMPAGLSNYEKCCYFALVLAAGNEYDYAEQIVLYDYPAYSALVKGKAICSGYAQAFARLCRESGISCWYCRGTTPEGRHAWNMLDTEEGVVYIDVTWYDAEKITEHYQS